jgi:hypothetical protein
VNASHLDIEDQLHNFPDGIGWQAASPQEASVYVSMDRLVNAPDRSDVISKLQKIAANRSLDNSLRSRAYYALEEICYRHDSREISKSLSEVYQKGVFSDDPVLLYHSFLYFRLDKGKSDFILQNKNQILKSIIMAYAISSIHEEKFYMIRLAAIMTDCFALYEILDLAEACGGSLLRLEFEKDLKIYQNSDFIFIGGSARKKVTATELGF